MDTSQGKVCLWIGASTMVEYTYQEAIDLLESQLVQSHMKIQELMEDLYFLRGNSITVEVNMARLFNYSVKLKKAKESLVQSAIQLQTYDSLFPEYFLLDSRYQSMSRRHD